MRDTCALYQSYADRLDGLRRAARHRGFKSVAHDGAYVTLQRHKMLNLSSNDYLGLAARDDLKSAFLGTHPAAHLHFSSSSSRLLTGNFGEYEALEACLSAAFGRPSLLFNSGYHMNIGVLPALADAHTLIISDELIHASIIDGIRLSKAHKQRFAHQDLDTLERQLSVGCENPSIERIIVVTESIFSMDGDKTDLARLVALKTQYPKVMLYVDEAHAIGICGPSGLGCAEDARCIDDIDCLLGTFGKALASMGGYIICSELIRDYLINTVRPLIFSTALPPMCMAWTHFIFEKMRVMRHQRDNLHDLGCRLRRCVAERGRRCLGSSHLVPIVYGENADAVTHSQRLQAGGFYVLPIRPPTVAERTARVRIGLRADLSWPQIARLLEYL